MNDEMISHKNNKIWILMNETFKNRKIFIDKWVYKCKKNIHEKIIRYKIRWYVKNFEQLKNFDYHETFVSMIKSMSYKIIFVIVAINDWDIEQMNVKIVFFYDIVNEKIYVKIFDDYRDSNRFKIICRFRKILYDLKQAFKVWSNTLKKFLKQHDFIFLNVDQNVFCDEKTIIIIYVDDLLIIDLNSKINKNIKTALSKRFQMIDLDFMTHYLDMRLDRDKQQRILWFSQQTYLKKIFKNHEFMNSKSVQTSMKIVTKLEIVFEKYVVKFDFKHIYQSIVDFFMYAMLDTRFDIIFVVFVVNRYVFNSIEKHWIAVKRIFRYLKNTLHLRLTFTNSLKFFVDYIDADWTDDKNTRRFIFDYVFNFDNEVIIWFFKRQFTIALSICEVEYID